ncbi:unnamed protein product [Echinostoma caproni]|uniref:Uncharacterized protein n=1 Tax=Echinostoma caproni TaxID=27848 RepID=A0A183ATL7_9TREM|nr:unnamed protein product [Echinostoma caproni]
MLIQYDGDGVVAAYGSMPDVDCEHCVNACSHLTGTLSAEMTNSRSCPLHLRVLLLNLDLPAMSDRTPCAFNPVTVGQRLLARSVNPQVATTISSSSDCIPPCLQIYSSVSQLCGSEREQGISSCGCFASTPWPIGGVQISVCATSGALRLAWASPDAQIKVISCMFDTARSTPPYRTHHRTYPQGTSNRPQRQVTPFAFKTPLLTQNYCSRCYCWPARDIQPCHLYHSSSSDVDHLDPFVCLFRQKHPITVVANADHWPDNHKQSEVSSTRWIYGKCLLSNER